MICLCHNPSGIGLFSANTVFYLALQRTRRQNQLVEYLTLHVDILDEIGVNSKPFGREPGGGIARRKRAKGIRRRRKVRADLLGMLFHWHLISLLLFWHRLLCLRFGDSSTSKCSILCLEIAGCDQVGFVGYQWGWGDRLWSLPESHLRPGVSLLASTIQRSSHSRGPTLPI
jgi:hypothetical protein